MRVHGTLPLFYFVDDMIYKGSISIDVNIIHATNLQDTVESVLADGVDVNRVHGTLLPLHCACMAGDVDNVKLILDHGAEVIFC